MKQLMFFIDVNTSLNRLFPEEVIYILTSFVMIPMIFTSVNKVVRLLGYVLLIFESGRLAVSHVAMT